MHEMMEAFVAGMPRVEPHRHLEGAIFLLVERTVGPAVSTERQDRMTGPGSGTIRCPR